jgi:intracellular sulfur oxidation DsrE/DsrF family protein
MAPGIIIADLADGMGIAPAGIRSVHQVKSNGFI